MCSLRCMRILMMMLLAWVLISTTSTTAAAGSSTKLLNFIDLYTGDFDNQWQVDEDEKYGRPRHSHIHIFHIPATVPAVSSDNAFLGFEMIDNHVKLVHVEVLNEDPDGVIRMLRYNITNTDKFSLTDSVVNSVDSVDAIDLSGLQTLTPEDLEERIDCESTWSEIEPNVFFGLFPDCRDQRTDIIPMNHDLFTCSGLSIFFNPGNLERYTTVPYFMKAQRR